MKHLKIFELGHDCESTTNAPFINKVNLNSCLVNGKIRNDLAESRFFLSPLATDIASNFVGSITYNWKTKYPKLISPENLNSIIDGTKNNVVYAPQTHFEWYPYSISEHDGIEPYLIELISFTNLPITGSPMFWANNFICTKQVFLEFIKFFRCVFEYFDSKYQDNITFSTSDRLANRKPAVFYERVAALYFSNRNDLIISQIPNR